MSFLQKFCCQETMDKTNQWYRQKQDPILYEPEYSKWKGVLLSGDESAIQEYLTEFPLEQDKYKAINGIFEQNQKALKWASPEHKNFAVITPLAMVMSCASISGMECLLRHGANVSSQDPYGHNPVHLIICFSFVKPELNHIWVAMFEKLVACVPFAIVKQMFLEENNQGLRPLEFAAQQGTVEIGMCMWEVPGIYLHQSTPIPGGHFKLYNVTEYESGDRQNKSPVKAIAMLKETIVSSTSIKRLQHHPMTSVWHGIRTKMNGVFISILLLWKLAYFTTFMILQTISIYDSIAEEDNSTECTNFMFIFVEDMSDGSTAMAWILASISLVSLVSNCAEFTINMLPDQRIFMYNLTGKKRTVAQNSVYYVCMFLSNVCVLSFCIIYLIDDASTGLFVNTIRLCSPTLMVVSILYYIQPIPVVGYYVIAIQRMFVSMMIFTFMGFILILPFALSFIMVLSTAMDTQCIPGFTDIVEAYYSMFKLMMGLMTLDDYVLTNNPVSVWILHMFYMFESAILLLNFLIAIMTDSMAAVRRNKEMIQMQQNLSIYIRIEKKFGWLMKRYYTWAKQKYFVIEGDKIYLPCVVTDTVPYKSPSETGALT